MADERRVRIGNQTAFSAERVTLPFEFAVDHGFDAFEWFPDRKESGEGWSVRDVTPEVRSWIRQTAAEHDIELSVHAPWTLNPLDPEAEAALREAIGFAREIGATLFNIHLQADRGIGPYFEALLPFFPVLRDAGIALAVENTVNTSPRDFVEFFTFLRKSAEGAAARVGICLDLGHANLFHETRNDYLRFVDMLPDEVPIIHIHLHENYGDRDAHLTVFTGPAGRDDTGIRGFAERMKRRSFSGCIILEQWPNPELLLVEARDRLLGILGEKPELPQTEKIFGEEEDIVAKFVEANARFLSWRKRLEWVLLLLTDTTERPDLELLTYIAIYLRFLGTGEVRCGEDGGHYRPSHHASLSGHLYEKLFTLADGDSRFVIRKIYPWLPSFDVEFRRSEPLTLIRDIAHRNDIPQELKQEIKTTLQNKLHRSAGPEDLAVSAALLERITAPGVSYPQEFVAEFSRFHEELKDFFNAGSLKDLLARIIEKNEAGDVPLLRQFLCLLDHSDETRDGLAALELLTGIRMRLAAKLRTDSSASGLRLQIADVRLEDHAFVLLSLVMHDIEEHLAQKKMPWEKALRACLLAVSNIRLGGFGPEECAAIEAELNSVSSVFDPRSRDGLLRLKASVDRCLRLAESYRDKILSLFPKKAELLGHALGVAEHAIRVYADADIRSHPVFQLAKYASLLQKEIRAAASLPSWDVIVPGSATGTLLIVPSLSSLPVAHEGAAIVLAGGAEGDEEIPPYVAGIVVTAEIPLLSHLAVRARQNGTVFLFCGEEKRIKEMTTYSGKSLSIGAAGGNFDFSPAELGRSGEPAGERAKTAGPMAPQAEYPGDMLIALDRVTPSTGGGKAYGARRLGEIAERDGAGFVVPKGLVIPFGVMESSLRSDSALAEEYASLSGKMGGLPLSGQDDLERLREIILRLEVPDTIFSGVTRQFGKGRRLMVRSSSNCEDAEGMAGAGLYDSVANVPLSETASAIRRVWASLWNRRALDARIHAGIPHDECRMAILIQSMIPADIAFVMHTVNPVSGDEDEILIELAAGLGETLVSGREPGSPFRMVYRKKSGAIEMLSFASYSFASRPGRQGGTVRERVDYSAIPFSRDDGFRESLAKRIGEAGAITERAFGSPQDIEGLVSGEEVCLVQARPQQLLH